MGIASGRMRAERGRLWSTMAGCAALTMLPDADTLLLACGVADRGLAGHRGFTHTPVFALLVGAVVFLVGRARRWRRPVWIGCIATLLVASHGLLDAMAQDGRGIMFAFPFSLARMHLPWRPIPDAPLGLRFFSDIGLRHLAIELVEFLPFSAYALWPDRRHFEHAAKKLVALVALAPPRSSSGQEAKSDDDRYVEPGRAA